MATDRPHFIAPRGKLLCWKCGGNGTHEINKRDENGYPIGFIQWETCRHCDGEGLVVAAPANPICATAAKNVVPVDSVAEGWGNYGK